VPGWHPHHPTSRSCRYEAAVVIGAESRELVLAEPDVLDDVVVDDVVAGVAAATCAVDVPTAGSWPVAICT
jgi:hypothetical protein